MGELHSMIFWAGLGLTFAFLVGGFVGRWLLRRNLTSRPPRMVFLPALPACIFCGATAPIEGMMCCARGVDCGVWVKPEGEEWGWSIRCLPIDRGTT